MRTFLGVTVVLLAASGLLFLTTVPLDSSSRSGTHLKVSFGGAPESLDPAQVNGMLESRLLLSLYEGLTRLDPNTLEPKPGVAEEWEVSEDGKTWTFYFRTGDDAARWSNGKRVKPSHFEYAWKRVLSSLPPSPYDSQLYRYIQNAGKYYFSDTLSDLSADQLHVNLKGDSASDLRTLLKSLERLESYGTRDHVNKVSLFSRQFSRISEHRSELHLPEALQTKYRNARDSLSQLRTTLQKRPPVSWEDVGIDTGPDRISVTLKSPTPHFPSLAAFMTYYPVYPPIVKQHPSPLDETSSETLIGDETRWTKPGTLVTNGPFRLTEWVFSDRITMEKNPHYHDDRHPHVDRLTFFAIENAMTGLNMFLHGDLHLTTQTPNRLKKKLRDKAYFHEWVRFSTQCLRFNVAREPFDDARVRKAFAMAIDRSELTSSITRGKEQPTTRWVPDAERWYDPPKGIGFHPERARELLAEAGYPEGKGIKNVGLLITDDNSEKNMFVAIQKMLEKHLGVTLKAQKKEWSVYLSQMQKRNYDVCLSGWIGDYYDPMTFLDMFMTGGKNNRTNWGNQRYDRIIDRASRTANPAERSSLFRRAETILIRKQLPISPLFHPTNTALWNPEELEGVYKNSIGIIDPKYLKINSNSSNSSGR